MCARELNETARERERERERTRTRERVKIINESIKTNFKFGYSGRIDERKLDSGFALNLYAS